jgi:hypothetical protein
MQVDKLEVSDSVRTLYVGKRGLGIHAGLLRIDR